MYYSACMYCSTCLLYLFSRHWTLLVIVKDQSSHLEFLAFQGHQSNEQGHAGSHHLPLWSIRRASLLFVWPLYGWFTLCKGSSSSDLLQLDINLIICIVLASVCKASGLLKLKGNLPSLKYSVLEKSTVLNMASPFKYLPFNMASVRVWVGVCVHVL